MVYDLYGDFAGLGRIEWAAFGRVNSGPGFRLQPVSRAIHLPWQLADALDLPLKIHRWNGATVNKPLDISKEIVKFLKK